MSKLDPAFIYPLSFFGEKYMAAGWVLFRLHSPISVLVIVLLAIAAFIGVLGSSFSGTTDQYYRDQFLGISVSSYRGYDGPEFLVII